MNEKKRKKKRIQTFVKSIKVTSAPLLRCLLKFRCPSHNTINLLNAKKAKNNKSFDFGNQPK